MFRKLYSVARLIVLSCFIFVLQPFTSSVSSGVYAQNFVKITKGVFAADSADHNGAAWIDYDNDGDLDIFTVSAAPPNNFAALYRNDGNDQFTKITTGELVNIANGWFGTSWADINNDGNLDVFIGGGYTRMGSMVYNGDGKGGFRRNESWFPWNEVILGWTGAWGDYDNDGHVDLVVIHPFNFLGTPASSNFLFHNNGDGTFAEINNTPITATTAPFTVGSWSDYDQDGDIDLFIGSGPANGTLAPDFHFKNMLKETGKATFQPITDSLIATDSLDGQTWNWIDYDNDGDLDAYMTNYFAPAGMANRLYRNDGGKFKRVTDAGPIVTDVDISLANVWGDFDNDGDLDCYVANGGLRAANKYYRNNGNGTFESVVTAATEVDSTVCWGAAAGDYDNDGDLDLFVATKLMFRKGQPGRAVPDWLFRNNVDKSNHWINIECIGKTSNRSALGTKIKTKTTINGKSVMQMREISAQNTFNGQNELRVHFGFGQTKTIDEVTIHWPSGRTEIFKNVKTDQFLVATEGEGISSK